MHRRQQYLNTSLFGVCLCLLIATSPFSLFANGLSQSFRLNQSAATSAGVYDKEGNLLRTLWSNILYPAGTHPKPEWDGLDDFGVDVRDKAHYFKVIANNIEVEWEGVIGNTSDRFVGEGIHSELNFYHDMLIHDGHAYFSHEYSEREASVMRSSLQNMQRFEATQPRPLVQQATDRLATDGVRLYMAGRQPFKEENTYVQAAEFDDLMNYSKYLAFQGSTVQIFAMEYKVADFVHTPSPEEAGITDSREAKQYQLARPRVTGLAVQRDSNYLFVARQQLNSVRVLHKITGELLQTLTFTEPKHLRISDDNTLWMVHGENEVLEKFSIDSMTGVLSSAGVSISGFANVQSVAISPNKQIVAVADAGSSHRVFGYSIDSGELQWTVGRNESYIASPKVYDNKFLLRSYRDYDDEHTFLVFQDNDKIWVGDRGNLRYSLFNTGGQTLNQVMWLKGSYNTQVDLNNTSRVFSDYFEFSVDYSKPLQPVNANQAWRFVNNWGERVPQDRDAQFARLENVTTLSNGRTYAFISASAFAGTWEFIELVENDGIRFTGVVVDNLADATELKKDGMVRWVLGQNGVQTFYQRPIISFDRSHNPVLGATTIWDSYSETGNYVKQDGAQEVSGEFTSNGNMVIFNSGPSPDGRPHLAARKQGAEGFAFTAANSVTYEYRAPYPHGTGTFDMRSGVVFRGNVALAMDDWILWGYHGEFWRNSQTNKWHMVNEDGLFLRDFGVAKEKYAPGEAGMAGNAFSPALVKVGENAYLWHNDESFHGGVHRWKISNLNSVQEFDLSIDDDAELCLPIKTENSKIAMVCL
ncbi:MAG: hypothetical protein KTR16_12485 [Acidiferrobacterales bacterium]|nr:hypothetical protein [Acidiferrobacterales bacterium]